MAHTDYLKRPYARVVVPESDGSFRGEILEFPGCIAVGDTAAQALSNLEDVAASWVESMIARGQPIPEPLEDNDYSGKLVLRLSKSVHQKAALAAKLDGVSLNYFIANCVAEQVGFRTRSVTLQTSFQVANLSFSTAGALASAALGIWRLPVHQEQLATSSPNKFIKLPMLEDRVNA